MAVIRLDLEVDSEVHPELHATLTAIGSIASRGERLRQLASMGLVWEALRLRSQALPDARASGAGPELRAVAAAVETAPRPSPRAHAARSVDADFVDLAIGAVSDVESSDVETSGVETSRVETSDAEAQAGRETHPGKDRDPVPTPIDDAARVRVFERVAATEVRQLPVLLDVVEVPSVPAARPGTRSGGDRRRSQGAEAVRGADGGPPWVVRVGSPAGEDRLARLHAAPPVDAAVVGVEAALEAAADAGDEAHVDTSAEAPPSPRPATRSRLKRMNEKGLFRNG